MKQMQRAVRRRHCPRLKWPHAFYRGCNQRHAPREPGRVVNTPTPRSSWMCGTPANIMAKSPAQSGLPLRASARGVPSGCLRGCRLRGLN